MALEFARVHVISRGAGHSAIKASAYRAGENLYDEKLGQSANYSHRAGEVLHSEILLPEGADPQFSDRVTLWNAIEQREDEHNRRTTAQLAKDHIIALPKELTHEQHVELVREFAKEEFLSKGLVVDVNIHGHSDGNPHAHLMTPTRALDGDQFGLKCRELNGGFYAGRKVPDAEMLKVRWGDFQEAYFSRHKIDLGVTRNNGDYPAELHLGSAHGMEKDGKVTVKKLQNDERIEAREAAILADPSIIIDRVSSRKSVFSAHDLYRETSTVVRDSEVFAAVKAKLDVHESLIHLNPDLPGKTVFTTQAVIDTEMAIRGHGEQLSRSDKAFEGIEPEAVLAANTLLSDEQRDAVRQVVSGERMASVIGLAGAGKSTMLGVAKAVFDAHGHSVRGIALAGKAAEELEKASGIASSTIHSWLYRVEDGRELLKQGDVVVMDEAGMVDNALMARVISQVNQAGAKLVMVGDTEQLQPIQAGRPFRDLNQRFCQHTEIATIRRQQEAWQRENTLALARGQGDQAVEDYHARGFVPDAATRDQAIERLVADYLADVGQGGSAERHAVLAHSNKAVDAMNTQIRAGLIERGVIGESQTFTLNDPESEEVDSSRSLELGVGDRVLFTKNNTGIGVKNGTLGEVTRLDGNQLQVKTDNNEMVSFNLTDYSHIRHGYAMTIHKSQGITVDRTSVLATPTLNKHLGYVAMSRHRGTANLYFGRDDFASIKELANRFTQVERAESVTDFAERHGVDLETGQRTESTMDTEAVGLEPIDSLSVEEASQLLESTRLALIETKNSNAQRAIQSAEHEARKAKRAVDDHRSLEPRQGLFASKEKHRVWKETLESLEKQSWVATKTVSTLKTEFEFSEEKFERQARREAKERHPEAADIANAGKAQQKAQQLFQKIETIQHEIDVLPGETGGSSQRNKLFNKLDEAIKDLSRDEAATKGLTPVQEKAIGDARKKIANRNKAQEIEERSRGGHEL